jgi:GcrA cell cycle regulator
MRGDLWTAERVELLRALWAKGETAVAIAARLGGPSRSAVLGKIYRLRLHTDQAPLNAPAKKPAPNKHTGIQAPARRRRRTKYKKRTPISPVPAPVRQYKSLLELTNTTCRWPHGRPGTDRFFFCGVPEADLERGIPYCPLHMQRAYPNGLGATTSLQRVPSRKSLYQWR